MQVPRYWREIPKRYRLEASECINCHNVIFPEKLSCPQCSSKAFKTIRLSGKGKLVTHTIIRIAPEGFNDQVPYAMGIIKMEEGPQIMAQITDCDPDKLKTGDPMIYQFRRIRDDGNTGVIMYAYKFVPDVGI
ncbi:MAG: Zn-ribbon domain-containing OB-fold protein [Acidobacteriota bacterium]